MRICFVAGPGSIHTQRWAAWFVGRGHEVHVVFPHSFLRPNALPIDGAVMHAVPTTPAFFKSSHLLLQPLDHFRLKHILNEIRPDVLHAHYVRDYGFRAAETGFHPLVVTVWGSDVLVDPVGNPFVRWEVSRTLRKADLITCDASHIVPAIRSLAGPGADIRIVNFGIDTRLFAPVTPDAHLKERLGVAGKRVVISTRSLRPIYDIATLIRSIPLILGNVPEATFVIVGGGPESDPLRALAQSLGVADEVRFIGHVPNEQLPQYLCMSEVYVSTSLSDAGIAASTAEAMACGLPVVISDFGDNAKWVREGEGGYLFPCGNHEALASRLTDVLTAPQVRDTAARVNRDTVLERCDRDTEMAKMEQIYGQLLARRAT
jgi:glycosyltransferase involved in cell wall biosynthesis